MQAVGMHAELCIQLQGNTQPYALYPTSKSDRSICGDPRNHFQKVRETPGDTAGANRMCDAMKMCKKEPNAYLPEKVS